MQYIKGNILVKCYRDDNVRHKTAKQERRKLKCVVSLFLRCLFWGGSTPLYLACFVLYLKIMHTFLKKVYVSHSNLSMKLKDGIKI